MKKNRKKSIAIGITIMFLSAGIITAASNVVNHTDDESYEDTIVIQFEFTGYPKENQTGNESYTNQCNNNIVQTFEKRISLSSKETDELINNLEKLNEKILSCNDIDEQMLLYDECINLFVNYGILPPSFCIENIKKTIEEISYELNDKYTNHIKDILSQLPNAKSMHTLTDNYNPSTPSTTEIHPGEWRLDFGSVFFIVALLSEIIPFNIVPNPPILADAIEISVMDFTLGRTLADMFPIVEEYTFLVGWGGGVGYAEFLAIPGNSLIGGQALYSWPSITPMYQYLYGGSSFIIPIGYGTGYFTILLDRGERHVPVPLFDIGVFGSILTVHMPYSKGPYQ